MSVELSSRAVRDLGRVDAVHRKQIRAALEALESGELNIDVKPLTGRPPWQRLRTGDCRILFRTATYGDNETVILVWRMAHRRDLQRAVGALP